MTYRSLGLGSRPDRIGAGVMDKAGIGCDHEHYRAATYSLVYLLRGSGHYVDQRGAVRPISVGDCFQRLPGVPHTTLPNPESRWLEVFVDLGPSLYAGLATTQIIEQEPLVWHWGLTAERLARFTRLRTDIERASEAELPRLALRCVELVLDARAEVEPPTDQIELACRALAEDRSRVDLEQFCKKRGLGYERFRKQFRARLGVSPSQYRIRRRIDRACELLSREALSIAEIAERLGYTSPYEFSAQFTRRVGMPPSKYRRRARRPPS